MTALDPRKAMSCSIEFPQQNIELFMLVKSIFLNKFFSLTKPLRKNVVIMAFLVMILSSYCCNLY